MRVTTTILPRTQDPIFGLGLWITAVILLTLFWQPLNAQTKLGFRGGLNISEPGLNSGVGNTSALTKSFAGLDIAFVSEFKVGGRLDLQAELGYVEKGIRFGGATNVNVFGAAIPVGVMTITKVRQLELPVLAKYRMSTGAIRPYAVAGPTLGYAINGNFKTRGTLLAEVDLVNQDLNFGNQNRFSFGLVGGVGMEVEQGPGTLFVDARYQYQALNFNNLPINDVRFSNSGVAFNVGYKFTI